MLIRAFLLSCLLLSSSCAYRVNDCPKRPKFTGETYGDLIKYNHQLGQLYDSCIA